MASRESPELRSLRQHKEAIVDRIAYQAGPEWLSLKLQTQNMIAVENASAITGNLTMSVKGKVNLLMEPVESKVRHSSNPSQPFQEFVEMLQSSPALEDLSEKLKKGKY